MSGRIGPALPPVIFVLGFDLLTTLGLAGPAATAPEAPLGSGQATAGVRWMGAVRGHLGNLFMPTMLIYGTKRRLRQPEGSEKY